MHKLDWIEGAPDELRPGMFVLGKNGTAALVGDFGPSCQEHDPSPEIVDITIAEIVRWAWLAKPHELEWLEAMAPK